MLGIAFEGIEGAKDEHEDLWAPLRTRVIWRLWMYSVNFLQ